MRNSRLVRRFVIVLGLVVCTSMMPAFAGLPKVGPTPWYELGQKPLTLKGALAAELARLGPDNHGYKMGGAGRLCAVLKSMKLACNYNTRMTLSMFLTVNGKGLYPNSGGSNPATKNILDEKLNHPEDVYVGTPIQNMMLREAIERNHKLFKDGDLTAEDVQKRWR